MARRPGVGAIALGALLVLPGCGGPRVDENRLRAVYAAKDLPLDSAHLWRPPGSSTGGLVHDLGPLLIQQAHDRSDARDDDPFGQLDGGAAPTVYLHESTTSIGGRSYRQWTYLWSYPVSPPRRRAALTQGVRMTLADNDFPLTYEVLHDSSGVRLVFVETSVEEAAAEQYGSLLPGRRFTIERAVDQTPDVAVPAILEPGPTPLGPFVYLFSDTHDVDTILCRCMPSRVEAIVGNAAYHLAPLTAAGIEQLDPSTRSWILGQDGRSLERLLRLPVGS